MKKLISVFAIFTVTVALLSAQVLPKQGIQNTLSISMGEPFDRTDNNERDVFNFYGFVETLQARVDIFNFTIEGMLNWGALYIGNDFVFANTGVTPFAFTNNIYNPDGMTDSYYVNFLFHPFDFFDLGMGTRLNWVIGPAPYYSGMLWEPSAHVAQGGLKEKFPGDADVVGYVYYPNCYARTALGARLKLDFMEFGVAIPSNVTILNFRTNFAFNLSLIDWFCFSAAVEVSWTGQSNFYAGLSFDLLENLKFDTYFAADNVDSKTSDNVIYGIGATLLFAIPEIDIFFRPEGGVTLWENIKYSPAVYTGLKVTYLFANCEFGLWGSVAWGSKNKDWYDVNSPIYEMTKFYDGGFVFDIRPEITYSITNRHSVSLMFDFQGRNAFNKINRNSWATSIYWTYKL